MKHVWTAAAGYGLAIASFGPMLDPDGSLPGFTSFMAHDPKTSTTLIVRATVQSAPDGRMVANEIACPVIGAHSELTSVECRVLPGLVAAAHCRPGQSGVNEWAPQPR